MAGWQNLPLATTSVDAIHWVLEDPTGTAISSMVLSVTPPVLEDWNSVSGLTILGGHFLLRAHVIRIQSGISVDGFASGDASAWSLP